MNTSRTARVSIPALKNFLRYMERENIKWSEFRFLPPPLKSHMCEILANDYNKKSDNEEDTVSPELVAFALSGDIRFCADRVESRRCVYEFH